MVNREDVLIRTLAEKTHAANRDDAHLRTAAQKVAASGATPNQTQAIIIV